MTSSWCLQTRDGFRWWDIFLLASEVLNLPIFGIFASLPSVSLRKWFPLEGWDRRGDEDDLCKYTPLDAKNWRSTSEIRPNCGFWRHAGHFDHFNCCLGRATVHEPNEISKRAQIWRGQFGQILSKKMRRGWVRRVKWRDQPLSTH